MKNLSKIVPILFRAAIPRDSSRGWKRETNSPVGIPRPWRGSLFFLLLFILFIHPIPQDGDTYHHLHTGKFIIEHGTLPRVDAWTFTENGKPWIAHSWASATLFYLMYHFFGPAGVSILVAIIGLITCILIYIFLKSYSLKSIQIYPLLLLIVSLFLTRFPARPEIFTFPFLMLIFLIDRLNLKHPRLTLLYPLIIFSWSIFYGANVVAGLVLLLILTIVRIKTIKPLYVTCVAISFFVSFLNGYGLDSIFYFLKIRNIGQFQGEWLGIFQVIQRAPPSYLDVFKFRLIIYGFFLLLYVSLLLVSFKIIRKHLLTFFLSLGIFLPFLAFRQVPLAATLSLPLLAVCLANQPKNSSRKFSLFISILAAFSILISLSYNFPGLEFKDNPAKVKLARFIEKNELSGKAYTSQQIGSYLSFTFHPKILVSHDTRDDLFIGGKFLKDILSPRPFDLILDKYDADLVVLDIHEDAKRVDFIIHSPKWIKIYLEDNYVIMKRK